MSITPSSTPNVGYQRPELTKNAGKYRMIKDCIEGQEAVKARGDFYLPRPDPTNCTEENMMRYNSYLRRAVFYNVLQRTLSGMTGLVFQQQPEMLMPDDMEVLKVNIDGAGIGAIQQMRKCFKSVLAFGRAGLLTDFPKARIGEFGESIGFTRKELMDGDVQPTVTLYMPWQIINWREEYRNGKVMLTQVVICEQIPGVTDGFQQDYTPVWRHLYLDEEGNCNQSLWVNKGDKNAQNVSGGALYVTQENVVVRDSNGLPLKFIPFQFIGSETNSAEIDPPPMYDLAVLNIAHYRNSADYEESCFVTGQPTVWASGLTEAWVEDVLKGELRLGSFGGIPLPANAAVGIIQTNPNTQPFEAMKQKEAQMIAIGARLIRENGKVERREVEIKNEAASEASLIVTVAQNVEAAYRKAIEWCGLFYGHPKEEITINLSYNFIYSQLTYQERQQLVNEWIAGAITFSEMRSNLKQAGIAKLTDEEAKKLIDEELAERDAREVAKEAEKNAQAAKNSDGQENNPEKTE
ncbi:DUF4055 domain-containing protein [Salmonella enterica subsp. enterica serovar Enteritidis]|nr:DUF4055 domain-containing protein [Salmonella enterica subsp. enterica serovar Enteritidis]ECW6121921.1 DUF4055 domain-containing protein [Salmonella enterica subsp. enterica serovar Enteritidis]